MKVRLFAIAVVAFFLAASASANADTVYTSQVVFDASSAGLTTFGLPSPGYGGYTYVPTGSTNGSITLTYDPGLSVLNLNDAAYYFVNFGLPANVDNYLIIFNANGSPTDTLTITFPSSTAFSVELGGTFGTGEGVTIGLSDGFSSPFVLSSYATSGGPPDFLGFTSNTPLTSATFTFNDGPDIGTIDQIQYGAATPEPGSLILLGTGLLGFGRMIRRRMAA